MKTFDLFGIRISFGISIREKDRMADAVTELAVGGPDVGHLGRRALETMWADRNGIGTLIAEMHENHAKNALALIVDKLRTDRMIAYMGPRSGRVLFSPIMDGLVADELAFIDETGKLIITELGRRSTQP